MESDEDGVISLDSLFHKKWPATAKVRSANCVRYLRTVSCEHDPDHKPGLHSARRAMNECRHICLFKAGQGSSGVERERESGERFRKHPFWEYL